MEYVLASASPRRKELLAELIEKFEIIPSAFEEVAEEGLAPSDLVKMLAEGKAKEVALRAENAGKIVIGSDTVVAYGDEVLGKPKDAEDAFRMLKMLSGASHSVYTGVCFAILLNGELHLCTEADRTDVHFKELSDEWIWAYIRGGSPMDKAGAYGIQDGGLVDRIEGSYTNVVGFPIELVKKMLEKEWV